MAAAPNSVLSLQKVLEKCEPIIRHIAVIVMRNGSAYLILSQSGWCFHNVDICWHISMRCLLQDAWVMKAIRICKMMFLTAAQNRCIKSMPNMAHVPDKFRTPEEQFLENSCLFKVIRSAWLFQLPSLPNACDAVATLIFGSDSKVAPNTHLFTFALRHQETWQTWHWAQKFTIRRRELHIA